VLKDKISWRSIMGAVVLYVFSEQINDIYDFNVSTALNGSPSAMLDAAANIILRIFR
jgi:hypothetical protein